MLRFSFPENKKPRPPKARCVALVLSVLLTYAGQAAAQEQPPVTASRPAVANPLTQFAVEISEPWIADTDFVWGARLAAFDLPDYINRNAPHLSARAEFIAHWCGYYSISPKVLLTILQMQSALVSTPPSSEVLANPFAGLVEGSGLDQQVLNALSALYTDFHAYRNATAQSPAAATTNAATYALLNLLRGQASPQAFSANVAPLRGRFLETLLRMFPEPLAAIQASDVIAAVPPINFLQFPWKHGVSWYVGGVHTTTGANDGSPMSSLDSSLGGQGWGSDTSTSYVVAAHSGTVTVFSSCNVRVTAPSGWQTNYYHLAGVIVTTGQQIAANQTIGVYANTQAQALCQGGSSTGPHVHYSLLNDGIYNSLDGATLNGYLVKAGRFSYDTDCNYSWLEKDGVKYCPNTVRLASSPASVPNLTINDVSVTEGNSGTKNATFTVSLSSAAVTSTTVNYQTEDVTTWSGVRGNTQTITIPVTQSAASPYPSSVTIPSGVGTVTKVTVVLRTFSHTWPSDVQALLVGPAGQKVILLGNVGGSSPATATLTFDDSGLNLPLNGPIVTGTYKPLSQGSPNLPSPAPAPPYATTLSAFNGTNPTGTWSLYVYDSVAPDGGSVSGWQLNVTTALQTDIVPASGVLTIASGATSQSLSIVVNGDVTIESTETFRVLLFGADYATITDDIGVGTITTDDVQVFTDATLSAGSSVVKAVHITELRTRIDAARAGRGLGAFSWTDPALGAGVSMIRGAHLTELRSALAAVYTAAGLPQPSYTDASPGGLVIRAVHIEELRAAVMAVE